MRTIRIIEHVSLDGVIQAPGGPGEDPEGGFDFGGWAFPHHGEDSGAAIDRAQGRGFDLLLGARPMTALRATGRSRKGRWPTA